MSDNGRAGREPSPVIRRNPAYRPPPAPPPRRPPPPPRTPPPPAPRPVPKARRKRRWGRLFLVTVLVLLVALVGVGAWTDHSLHRTAVFADNRVAPPGHGTTWLLVGSDSRSDLSPAQQTELATGGDTGSGRTDTIIVVHIPGLGSDVPTTMVSIPRDSYVSIPGQGQDKINAAFALGGPQLLVRTVEQATGIRLDHYAEIGFGGFAQLVDALGGVTMCVTDPISDPLAGIDLPAGCQKLDGRNALGYVRSRATARADLDRMIHQRKFMSALLHSASSPAVWLNPFRWYPVERSVTAALTVDDGTHLTDLSRLGWALHGSMVTTTVPIGEFTTNDSGDVVVWNKAEASRLFTALSTDAPVPPDVLQSQ